jgi:hypothetical protein
MRTAERRTLAARLGIVSLTAAVLALAFHPLSRAGDVAPALYRAGSVATAQHVERMRYRATWNGIPVANAELLIQPEPGGARSRSVVLRGRAETNEVLDLLWRMRDSVEATVGADPVVPLRFSLRQNENDRRRDTTIVAQPPRLIGSVEKRHRRVRRADVPLTPRLHDPASVAYLIRTLPKELDQRPTYSVLAGTKIYALTIAPAGTENVEVAGRVWPARRLHLSLALQPKDVESPSIVAGTPTRDPDERDDDRNGDQPWRDLDVQEADLWISSGPERVPLRMSARTFWGWVSVELVGRGAPPST